MAAFPSAIRACASGLALTLWLAWASIIGAGCAIDEFLGTDYYESRVTRGPEKRSAKKPDTRCYESFDKYKDVHKSAGKDMHWHHIVGQHAANERKFGKLDLNCTDNVIRIPKSAHYKINAHYSSKNEQTQGKTVRDWLAPQSFNEQYEYGIQVLQDNGIRW